MTRESGIAKDIEAVLEAGAKVGIPPHAPVKIAYGTPDWRIVVAALQDAYRANEFQRINGEKNTEIDQLTHDLKMAQNSVLALEKRLTPPEGGMSQEEIEKLIMQEASILSSPPPHLIGTGAAQNYAEERLRKMIARVLQAEVTCRDAILQEAMEACAAEHLEEPQGDEDLAYDLGVTDCYCAIKKMLSKYAAPVPQGEQG